jgi:exosortase
MAPVIGFLIAIYWSPLAALFEEYWHSSEQSQGLVIIPLAIGIAWLRRGSLPAIPAGCEAGGLATTAFGCTLHLFGLMAAGNYVSGISLVVVLAGVLWTLGGIAWLRAMALPILLLAVAIPLPSLVYSSLSMPLQLFASATACRIADLLGVVVYREGNIIHLAGMSLGIWEACSGLSSLSSLFAGSVLMGFLISPVPRIRVLVCLAAIPIAVISNIVRVAGTAILSDWHPAYAVGFYHAFSGWLVFLIGAICLYAAAIGLRRVFHG